MINYLESFPSKLIDIVISFLDYDDLLNFIDIIPNGDLINWINIFYYRYNKPLVTIRKYKDVYINYFGIEVLIRKFDLISHLNNIDKIYNLVSLNLSHSELIQLPKDICNLDLSYNKLIKIPKEINNLKIYITGNKIKLKDTIDLGGCACIGRRESLCIYH